jgi:hypothetical protein
MVFAVQLHDLTPKAGTRSLPYFALQARGHWFEPSCATKFLQLDGLFETLIGPVTVAGNHRCILPYGGRVPRGRGSIPFDYEGAPCADGRLSIMATVMTTH